MSELVIAKNFVLIPAKSHNALVIRRGPSKQVGIFSLNLKSKEVQCFQWLKGRIYEYFCDISSDGKYLIYSAIQKGESYTVISKAPWLKALSLWRNVGGCVGGLISKDASYMLFDGDESYNEFRSSDCKASYSDRQVLENGVYSARLELSGWKLKESNEQQKVFVKKLGKNTVLEKIWHKWSSTSEVGKPSLWEHHELIVKGERIKKNHWEWCEEYKNYLYWSEHGKIYRTQKARLDSVDDYELVHDFNSYEFVEMAAPY